MYLQERAMLFDEENLNHHKNKINTHFIKGRVLYISLEFTSIVELQHNNRELVEIE